MKRYSLALLVCLLCVKSFAQWTPMVPGTANQLYSSYFVDTINGYASGQIGTIIKTTNSGSSWSTLSTGTVQSLNSICFYDLDSGCAVGGSGTILKTTDAGATWSMQTVGVSNLNAVRFTTVFNGYAVGDNGTILKTGNGGITWTTQTSGTAVQLFGTFFNDPFTGYVVGGSGTILKTGDGGITWTPLVTGTSLTLNSVYFTDVNTGYAAGVNGTVLKTSDAGTNWSPLSTGVLFQLNSVYFTSANTGYAAGDNGTILKTINAGFSWMIQNSGTANVLKSVVFPTPFEGFTFGGAGTALKTGNGGVSAISVTIASTPPSCSGYNDGIDSAIVTGGTPPYTFLWAPDGETTQTITGLVSGSYTVTVTDTLGFSDTAMVVLTAPSSLVANAGLTQVICFADSVTFVAGASGGTPAYSYDWSDGVSSYPTQTITLAPSTGTSFTLTVSDSHGCVSTDYTNTAVLPSTDIYGHVTYSGGNVTNGNVVMYKQLASLAHMDTLLMTTLDASGNYQFLGVNHNNYFIEVFADTTAYPTLAPTYYGNSFLWDVSNIVNHGCSLTDTLDIVMVEETGTAGGIGLLHGTIHEGAGYIRNPGDPVPGIDVKLGHHPGGQMVTNTTTNGGGNYTFSNLAFNTPGDSFQVFVDIPGLGRDSTYIIVVNAATNQYLNLDYYVDSAHVYILPGGATPVANVSALSTSFSVYPNPSKGSATVEYSINSDTQIALGIYNVLGVKVADLVNAKQSSGNYKVIINTKNYNLSNGVYFISLITNGKTNIHRLVVAD